MDPGDNAFWRFSLRTYRAPGVEAACLALQERCGADVNLLLFCGWVGREGRVLDEASLRSAVGRVGHLAVGSDRTAAAGAARAEAATGR